MVLPIFSPSLLWPKQIEQTAKYRLVAFRQQASKLLTAFLEKNMKTMKFVTTPSALSLLALAIITSSLARADDLGWYGGASIGQSKAKIDDGRIKDGLKADGFTTTSIDDDKRDMGYKLFGGYQFNKNFAVEGGFFDLGKFGFTANTLPAGVFSGTMKARGINVDAVGILPLTEKLSALGRVGLSYAQTRDAFAGSGAVNVLSANSSIHERNANFKVGLGLQYALTESLAMRVEAERYRLDDAVGNLGDVDLFSLGLVYRFGKTTNSSTNSSISSEPNTVAPSASTAPATQSQQYCSILDIQFEINQDTIQREESEKLAVVGTFLQKYPETTAIIEGHSDNVGAPEHNIALSQNRAESVVSYLQDSFKIAPSRLSAVGYGDTRPIADNSTEEGKRQNRRINTVIACATDVEGLTVVPARMTMAMDMEFDQNKADVKPQYDSELSKVAKFLKANPTTTATVEGHTGNLQLTPALAMEMSQRRAQNVVDYLVNNFGISPSRLTAEGFGQSRRFAYNSSSAGQQENRRVNIIINYAK